MGIFADLVVFLVSGNRLDYIFEDSNYFELDPLFAVLLNILTNQPQAQVTRLVKQ